MLLAYCVKNESSCVYISFFHKANAFRTLRSAEAQRLLERFIFKKENARRRHSAVRPKVSEKNALFRETANPVTACVPLDFQVQFCHTRKARNGGWRVFTLKKVKREAHSAVRPGVSGKSAFSARRQVYGLKRAAFQAENALKRRGGRVHDNGSADDLSAVRRQGISFA